MVNNLLLIRRISIAFTVQHNSASFAVAALALDAVIMANVQEELGH